MKKIAIVGNLYSNGGDYLIFDRIKKLINDYHPDYKVLVYKNKEWLNTSSFRGIDAIIGGGGGAQLSNKYIKNNPLFQMINYINAPIHFMGTGLYAPNGLENTINNYKYSRDVVIFLKKIIANKGQIASRDLIVDDILKKNGINNVIMTGCPAWYDLSTMRDNECSFKDLDFDNVKRIAVSNQGLTKNNNFHEKKLEQIKSLIIYLMQVFLKAEIILTFNDGYYTRYSQDFNVNLRDWAVSQKVKCVEICNGWKNFKLLDECDLHIGYRVHSHIYCVSKKRPSILIEEDIRGYGLNETWQMPHIFAYMPNCDEDFYENNNLMIDQIDMLFNQIKNGTGEMDYNRAYKIIESTYSAGMKKWLSNI